MIIDCHGHYTTVPEGHVQWRERQTAAFKAGGDVDPAYPDISDDLIRESIEKNQLRLIKERGADLTVFSPRASAMAPHVGNEAVSQAWSINNNNLIKRVVDLFPRLLRGRVPAAPVAAACRSAIPSPSWNAACSSWALSAAISIPIRRAATSPPRR